MGVQLTPASRVEEAHAVVELSAERETPLAMLSVNPFVWA